MLILAFHGAPPVILLRTFLVILGVGLCAHPAAAQSSSPSSPTDPPSGRWISSDRDHVMEFAACADHWCATTIGVVPEKPGAALPDPSCRKTVISQVRWDQTRGRFAARAHDPSDGSTYKAWLKRNGTRLDFRAWKGVEALGKTYRYSPFVGRVDALCRIEAP